MTWCVSNSDGNERTAVVTASASMSDSVMEVAILAEPGLRGDALDGGRGEVNIAANGPGDVSPTVSPRSLSPLSAGSVSASRQPVASLRISWGAPWRWRHGDVKMGRVACDAARSVVLEPVDQFGAGVRPEGSLIVLRARQSEFRFP